MKVNTERRDPDRHRRITGHGDDDLTFFALVYRDLKFFLYPNLPSRPYLRCMSWANRQIGWFGAVTGIDVDQVHSPKWDPKLLVPRASSRELISSTALPENNARISVPTLESCYQEGP